MTLKNILVLLVMFLFPLTLLSGKTKAIFQGDIDQGNDRSTFKELSSGLGKDIYAEWTPDPRWMTGVSWSNGKVLENSFGLGRDFFGSTIHDSDLVEIEIHFSNSESTLCATYRRDQGYAHGGVGSFPGSAWDISDVANPRRLNICFVEYSTSSKPANKKWDPDHSNIGGREYVFVMLSDYDESGTTYNNTKVGISADVMYSWWPRVRDGRTFLETNATLAIKFFGIQEFIGTVDDRIAILSWDYEGSSVSSFKIVYGQNNDPQFLAGTLDSNKNQYTVTGLTNNRQYYFKILGEDTNGNIVVQSRVIGLIPKLKAYNTTLLSNLAFGVFVNDITGFYQDDREFAVVGLNDGSAFVDVTDPVNPVEIKRIPGNKSSWRDLKYWDRHVYVGTEAAMGVQVISVDDPDNPTLINSIRDFDSSHNLYVADGYLYAVGTGGGQQRHDLWIYDLADPAKPKLVGTWDWDYLHDIHVYKDKLYGMGISSGFIYIVDVSNKSNPRTLVSKFIGITPHDAAVTEDEKFLLVADEGLGGHLRIFNIEDYNNIEQVGSFQVNELHSIHNIYIIDDVCFASYYADGTRIINIRDRANPTEIGYYRTSDVEGLYVGNWGTYPFLPSGNIISSDMETGLYVFSASTVLAIEGTGEILKSFTLKQNYPNPFNPITTIEFILPDAKDVNLAVYNILGERMETILNQAMPAGTYTLKWDGSGFPSGVYFIYLNIGTSSRVRKMTLLK